MSLPEVPNSADHASPIEMVAFPVKISPINAAMSSIINIKKMIILLFKFLSSFLRYKHLPQLKKGVF